MFNVRIFTWQIIMDARVKPAHVDNTYRLSTVIAGLDPAIHEAVPQ
jgi:hypothetical protein